MKPLRALPLAFWLGAIAVAGLPTQSGAQQPGAFAKGDAAAGKVLSERDCVECHERRFGNVATIYSRVDRRVRSPEQLLAQIRYCNAQLGSNYFPEEEEHVAAYLNAQYYKFMP
jgi:hypothetical protein